MQTTAYMEAKAEVEQNATLLGELGRKQLFLVLEEEGEFYRERHDEYMREYHDYAFWQIVKDSYSESALELEERAAWIELDEHKRSRNGNSHHLPQDLQDIVRGSGSS